MTSSTALANEGLFELTRHPSLTRAGGGCQRAPRDDGDGPEAPDPPGVRQPPSPPPPHGAASAFEQVWSLSSFKVLQF